jgi:hypothetical protein
MALYVLEGGISAGLCATVHHAGPLHARISRLREGRPEEPMDAPLLNQAASATQLRRGVLSRCLRARAAHARPLPNGRRKLLRRVESWSLPPEGARRDGRRSEAGKVACGV